MTTQITPDLAYKAHDEWGANCGPGALAAIMNMTLDAVRPHLKDFDKKHYTNPTMMYAALNSIGAKWRLIKPLKSWPRHGLVRVQWEGPWTKPGVPMGARYRHTHWVAASKRYAEDNIAVFDINAINNGTGWISLVDWCEQLAPWLMKEIVPKSNGRWHITHVIEIDHGAA
jgi:hypothetical protein